MPSGGKRIGAGRRKSYQRKIVSEILTDNTPEHPIMKLKIINKHSYVRPDAWDLYCLQNGLTNNS